MDATQSFRQEGDAKVVKISCDQDDGQNVVYWDEIVDVFPGVQYVKNGDVVVKKLRDPGLGGSKPHRIKHYPDVILDVVLSNPAATDPVASPPASSKTPATSGRAGDSAGAMTETSTDDKVSEDLQVAMPVADSVISDDDVRDTSSASASASASQPAPAKADPKTVLTFRQVVQLSQKKALESAFEQRLVTSLPPEVQAQVRASSDVHGWIVQAIQNGLVERPNEQLVACLEDLRGEMVKNNELASKNNDLVKDIKELALKNMELVNKMIKMQEALDAKQEALDAKQEEMKQLQIQALDQMALLHHRVKTLVTQTYELHEYPIPRLFIVLPQDSSAWDPVNLFSNKFRLYFLCECGEHTMSTNSKIPHHIHLAKHEGYEITRPKDFFQQYGSYVLTILNMVKLGISVAGVAVPAVYQLFNVDSLSRASKKLKDLSSSLQNGMDQAIGCIKDVTKNQGQGAEGFSGDIENNEALEGADLRQLEMFLKNKDGNKVLGNLYRTVTSQGHVKWVCIDHYRENYQEKTAKAFRDTVESMRGAFEENTGCVSIHLRSRTQADQFYQALESAKSVYELGITLDWDTTQGDFKKLRDTLRITNVGALYIDLKNQDGPGSDILNRSRRHDPILDIMRHPTVRSVTMRGIPDDFIERSSLQSRSDNFPNLKHMDLLLSKTIPGIQTLLTKSPNLACLTLSGYGEKVAQVYENAPGLKELVLEESEQHLGEACIKKLATLVSRSELRQLQIHLGGEEGRVQILESIQWDAMQRLDIELYGETVATGAMKALVEGMKERMSGGRVELEYFRFKSYSTEAMSAEQAELVRLFMSLTLIKELRLIVETTPEQAVLVLNSADVSRVEMIILMANQFVPEEVDRLLACLQNAPKLRSVGLGSYTPTQEQREMMKARGVDLYES
ncbi:hypothetical protein B0O80DRAFT_526670 [Mortierella sp. GBAus27b]|nr:hypothetical protein BGX31_011578 [Mortierella sp. GBA43]KAI8358923.1 hypothetical protein B0O80DRAFT_526670 [Mortierella sp. GBAus27b]